MFTQTATKVVWIILAAGSAGAPTTVGGYFPPGSLSPHAPEQAARYGAWFGGVLATLQEKPLARDRAADATYRYTLIPSFSPAIMVRVERAASGEAQLTRKELTAAGQGRPAVVRSLTRRLTDAEWRSIDTFAAAASFWELPPDTFEMGLDGAELLVEGAGPRGYHVVHRWSPDDGTFLRLCARLRELADIERPPVAVVDPRDRVTASLTGVATDASTGAPLGGVTVLVDGAGVSEARATDAHGRFAIRGLLAGIYQVRLRRFGAASPPSASFTFPDDRTFVRLRRGEETCLRASLGPPSRAESDQPPRSPLIRDCAASNDAASLPVQDHAVPARRP